MAESDQGDQLTLLDSDPGAFAFYAWKNVTIVIWPRHATGPALERLAKAARSIINTHPEGVSNVQIVAVGAGTPTEEVRAGFIDIVKHYSKQLGCVAIVLLGGGFWASALRATITSMRLIAPNSFPLRIHDNIEDVIRWLPKEHLKRTGVPLDPDKLASVLNTARLQQIPSSPTEKK